MQQHPTYRILDKIGEGSWTIVYEAFDNGPLQRPVAIKMLREEHRSKPHLRDQFWDRIKAMSDIRLDRILPIYNTDAERDWIVVELADSNLEKRIQTGRGDLATAQSYLAQILEALEELHGKKRRLHGEIKPTNILTYEASGRVKLTDPGVLINGDLQLVPGKEKYLSPELADPERWGNGSPGPQLDLYTLGFCILEMLAGPDFDGLFPGMTAGGADKASLWWQWHASEADPTQLIEKLVPKSYKRFRAALEFMLKKKAAERAASASAVLEVLGDSVIPEEIRQDAPLSRKSAVSDGGIAVEDRGVAIIPSNLPDTQRPAKGMAERQPDRPVLKNKKAKAPESQKQGLKKSDQKEVPFLQDTRKVRIMAGAILVLGIAIFIILNLGAPPSKLLPINITSNPSGAAVKINGKQTGQSPYTFDFKTSQEYKIEVSLEGYADPQPQILNLKKQIPENNQIAFTLLPIKAASTDKKTPSIPTPQSRAVVINSDPPKAAIMVGDETLQEHTPAKLSLKPGTYELEVSLEGYETARQKVTIPEGDGDFEVPVVALKPSARKVRIVSTPSNATIQIDGKPAGETDAIVSLSIGKHHLDISSKEYEAKSLEINIEPGKDDYELERIILESLPSKPTLRTNSIGMTLVKMDSGKFIMGRSQGDSDSTEAEQPSHEVVIDHDYYIGDSEVTVEQFQAFVDDTLYVTTAEIDNRAFGYDPQTKKFVNESKYSWKNTGWEKNKIHPVVNVSWLDAQAFCRWLSRKEMQTYRLPTEEEWEYACRAGTQTRFSFGDDAKSIYRIDNVADQALARMTIDNARIDGNDGIAFTAPIRYKGVQSANPWGLYHMHGNVSEWCQWTTDIVPEGKVGEQNLKQCLRGGSWNNDFLAARSSSRRNTPHDMVFNYVGFRVVGDLNADQPFAGTPVASPSQN